MAVQSNLRSVTWSLLIPLHLSLSFPGLRDNSLTYHESRKAIVKDWFNYLVYRLRIDEAVMLNILHGARREKASEIWIWSFDTILELQLREGTKKMCQEGASQRNNPSSNGRLMADTQQGNNNHWLDSIVRLGSLSSDYDEERWIYIQPPKFAIVWISSVRQWL